MMSVDQPGTRPELPRAVAFPLRMDHAYRLWRLVRGCNLSVARFTCRWVDDGLFIISWCCCECIYILEEDLPVGRVRAMSGPLL